MLHGPTLLVIGNPILISLKLVNVSHRDRAAGSRSAFEWEGFAATRCALELGDLRASFASGRGKTSCGRTARPELSALE